MTDRQIGKYERGEDTIQIDRLLPLAKHLTVSPWWLAGWADRVTETSDVGVGVGFVEDAASFRSQRHEALLHLYDQLEPTLQAQAFAYLLHLATGVASPS